MLKRFYVHDFRCLENFQLDLGAASSLPIGANGPLDAAEFDRLRREVLPFLT